MRQMTGSAVLYMLRRRVAAAGVARFSPHDLRPLLRQRPPRRRRRHLHGATLGRPRPGDHHAALRPARRAREAPGRRAAARPLSRPRGLTTDSVDRGRQDPRLNRYAWERPFSLPIRAWLGRAPGISRRQDGRLVGDRRLELRPRHSQCCAQVGPLQLRAAEVGPFQLRAAEVGPLQLRADEVGPLQLRVAEVGPLGPGLPNA